MDFAPQPDALSETYWQAAREGRLLIQRCAACGRHQFYPRAHCTACLAADPEWVEALGTGRLHTFTIVRKTPNAAFAASCPYAFAIVELDEGVRMTATIVDADLDALRCEQRLGVAFREGPGGAVLPCFAPEETA
jgi:uncharacterized OB-fold protein